MWLFGLNPKSRGSPHVRTTTLSLASRPSGTSRRRLRDGQQQRVELRLDLLLLVAERLQPRLELARLARSASRSAGSLACPIFWLTWFCSARSRSNSACACRPRSSSARTASTSTFACFSRAPTLYFSGFWRRSFRSIMRRAVVTEPARHV
jgi:hypothetical protein